MGCFSLGDEAIKMVYSLISRHFGRNFILVVNQRVTVKFSGDGAFESGDGEFYENVAVKLVAKSRYISRKTMEHSLFHILWKTSSTLCGEYLPQYVEEKFHGMWKSELCGSLQLIRRLFAANVSFVGSQRS